MIRTGPSPRSSESGAALIVVLAALVVLTVVGVAFNASTRIEVSVTRNFRNTAEARLISEGGVFRVLAELKEDTTYADDYNDSWSNNPRALYQVDLGRGQFSLLADDLENDTEPRIGIVDEASKININVVDREWLESIPGMSPEQASAILDWRDRNHEASEPGGAEREYYRDLPEPQEAKNAPFDTVMELLLVRHITMEDLFGEDQNRNGVLDVAENDGDQNPPGDNQDGELQPGWWPYLTVYSYDDNMAPDDEQRLNINKAGKNQFRDRLGELVDEADVDALIEFRGDDENKFSSVADLLDVPIGGGGDEKAFDKDELKAIYNYLTVLDEERIPGLVNINTAPVEVIRTIPDMTDEMASAIIEARYVAGGFTTLAELLDIEKVETEDFKKIARYLTVRSQVFRILSHGVLYRGDETSADEREIDALVITHAVVDRGERPYRILYWRTET